MLFFFFNDTATTEIYTLSLHDALPISRKRSPISSTAKANSSSITLCSVRSGKKPARAAPSTWTRSEEHTSELQSQSNLVCRLLLEKKKHTENSLYRQSLPVISNIHSMR